MDGIELLGAHAYPAHGPMHYVEPMGGRVLTGKMARYRLHQIRDVAEELERLIAMEDEIPAWAYDLIAVAYAKLMSVYGYIEPRASQASGVAVMGGDEPEPEGDSEDSYQESDELLDAPVAVIQPEYVVPVAMWRGPRQFRAQGGPARVFRGGPRGGRR